MTSAGMALRAQRSRTLSMSTLSWPPSISIIVPCHRVIGSDGRLTGYGGGLDRKQALLDMEAAAARGHPAPLRLGPRQLTLI